MQNCESRPTPGGVATGLRDQRFDGAGPISPANFRLNHWGVTVLAYSHVSTDLVRWRFFLGNLESWILKPTAHEFPASKNRTICCDNFKHSLLFPCLRRSNCANLVIVVVTLILVISIVIFLMIIFMIMAMTMIAIAGASIFLYELGRCPFNMVQTTQNEAPPPAALEC